MDLTRSTLLVRLRNPTDQAAWRTFDELYKPLLIAYALSRGLDAASAEDIAQQCVQVVLEKIGGYQHQASFKSWLRAIADHKVADRLRARRGEVQPVTGMLDARAGAAPTPEDEWDKQWRISHLRHCAEQARGEVNESTYAAFHLYAIEERAPEAVAKSLGISVNQVYVAKHRVLERIRAIMLELTGEDLGADA